MPSAEPPPRAGGNYQAVLANERTFLAWQRTSLTLIAAGIAVAQLLDKSGDFLWLGVLLVVAGAAAAVSGYQRYRRVDGAIAAGQPLPRTPAILLLAAALAFVGLAAALLLLL